ncbi:hypothetical protein C8J57DRAFT_1507735 [Mycena rebaudengoi]|nr:hypothetical protein C8J57DRAFT_1507735 [Mycena rebaudengoi]
MGDAQLVASISVHVQLEFRASVSDPFDVLIVEVRLAMLVDFGHHCDHMQNPKAAQPTLPLVLQFPSAFVAANPGILLSFDWVHPPQLRTFLKNCLPVISATTSIKPEPSEASVMIPSCRRGKSEDSDARIRDLTSLFQSLNASSAVSTRKLAHKHNDSDIYAILSSEDAMEGEEELEILFCASSGPPPTSQLNKAAMLEESVGEPDLIGIETISATVWHDTDIISMAIHGPAKINRQTKVERVEYLTGLPSYWPVPRIPTAYVVDLRDPKFDYYDGDGEVLDLRSGSSGTPASGT